MNVYDFFRSSNIKLAIEDKKKKTVFMGQIKLIIISIS